VVELNSFLLKHVFIVKPTHPLTLTRLALVCVASAPAIRQFYQYTVNPSVKRLGSQTWIFLAITVVELLIFFKLGSQHFERTILMNVVYWLMWNALSSFLTVYFCLYLERRKQPQREISDKKTL
ncbi:Phosphatidylserine synthase 2, partial [Cichlidogyrus casuarinus]